MSYATQIKSSFFCGFLFCLTFSVQGQVDTVEVQQPVDGIRYISLVDTTEPWRIHLLEINLQQASAELHSHKALPDGDPETPTRQTLPQMWKRLESGGLNPVAGINADFFNLDTGDPINIQISDHKPIFIPHNVPNRSQFGVLAGGTPFINILDFNGTISVNGHQVTIHGVNTLPPEDGLTLIEEPLDILPTDSMLVAPLQFLSEDGSANPSQYTFSHIPKLDPPLLVASGNMKDSLQTLQQAGDTLNTRFQFQSNSNENPIEELVGGAVQLIDDGKQVIDRQLDIEGVSASFASDRHPRTAIGMTDDRHLYMLVVDGRQQASSGMSLYELADFMTKYGITEALNLDGGGSTTMIVNGEIVNSPSDPTGPRPVSNALFLIMN